MDFEPPVYHHRICNSMGHHWAPVGENIQRAIDDLPATGGKVWLPEGTFVISSSITLTPNLTLIGAGHNTILQLEDNHDADINILDSGDGNHHFTIKNLQIDGNGANNGAFIQRGINIANPSDHVGRVEVKGCYIHHCKAQGVFIEEAGYLQLVGNILWRNSMWPAEVEVNNVMIGYSENVVVADNIFGNNSETSLFLVRVDHVSITGNVCNSSDIGGDYFVDMDRCDYIAISGNTVQNKQHGAVHIAPGTHVTISGNRVMDVLHGTAVIIHGDSHHVVVTGNLFYKMDSNGVGVGADGGVSPEYVIIQGNLIDSPNEGGAGDDGIALTGASGILVEHVLIEGNIILDTFGYNPSRGVDLGYTSKVTVKDNEVDGYSEGINIAATCTDTIVGKNRFTDTTTPISDAGTDTIIDNNEGNVGHYQTTTDAWAAYAGPTGTAANGTRVIVYSSGEPGHRLYCYSNGAWHYVNLT